MNAVKYRALAKDGTWRYGLYPCLNVDMGNTKYPMDVFWNNFLSTFRRETLGQWTGLLDKQGKEIYEGDILRVYNWGIRTSKDILGVVKVAWDADDKGWRYYPSLGIDDAYDQFRNVEVIGNIYESPALLTP